MLMIRLDFIYHVWCKVTTKLAESGPKELDQNPRVATGGSIKIKKGVRVGF